MRRKNTTAEMMKGYIADSLLLLMRTAPYDDITIGEITAKAGVNRSTYYRHFRTKDEIIMFFYNRIITEYIGSIDPAQDIALQPYLQSMFAHFLRYKDPLLVIYRAGVAHHILDALNALFQAAHADQTLEERFRLHYHTGGIYNTFLLWFEQGMRLSPEKLSALSAAILPPGQRPMLRRT